MFVQFAPRVLIFSNPALSRLCFSWYMESRHCIFLGFRFAVVPRRVGGGGSESEASRSFRLRTRYINLQMHSCFFKLEGRLKAGHWKVLYSSLRNKKKVTLKKQALRHFGVSTIYMHRAVHVFYEDHSSSNSCRKPRFFLID